MDQKKESGSDRKSYHHGHLAEALIAATVEIIEERGVDYVSVREAAKRAGVSPGAPFRHFRSKAALLTAVAEQAMDRLTAAVTMKQEQAVDSPMATFEAIGQGYLQWALANPTHFQIISSRTLIDFHASDSLRQQNEAIRQRMVVLLEQARQQGYLAEKTDIDLAVLSSRAFVYGLARMAIDGHFPEWHQSTPPQQAVHAALRIFIERMTVAPQKI